MSYEEYLKGDDEKPKKIKLKPDKPEHEESMFTPADKAAFGLFAILISTMVLIALFAPKPGQQTPQGEPLGIEQKTEEGPGKTWKEPGSARDTFNENFSR